MSQSSTYGGIDRKESPVRVEFWVVLRMRKGERMKAALTWSALSGFKNFHTHL